MRIVGLYNSHDGGYVVLEDGHIVEHTEFERYTREKESGGDSLFLFKKRFLEKRGLTLDDVDQFVSVMPTTNLERSFGNNWNTHEEIPKDKIKFYSHHLCHAANAYFSSPYNDAIVISIDNAGMEYDGHGISCGIYMAKENQIKKIHDIPSTDFSLGDLWGRCTRWVFKLWSGYPRGHQAGSVMAMAALGDSGKYYKDFQAMLGENHRAAVSAPPGAKRGVYVPPEEEVVHPFLNKYREIAEKDEQEKYNLAAGLQRVTEEFLWTLVIAGMNQAQAKGFITKNICFSGGCSLNSVAMGKIWNRLPEGSSIFIPPVPYDGGLNIGAAQYHYHSILGNPKVYNEEFCPPYLGETWSEDDIRNVLEQSSNDYEKASIDDVVKLIAKGSIVSVYHGKSESGRRALGNRSILANPGFPDMKQKINDKVKHRQHYRPFAPSVLDECGNEWFEKYFFSPYMGFVFDIKKDKLGKAPAIEHFDGTARIQSVKPETNLWYYSLIKKFYDITGIPMVLNTSFNDREPIVETPVDAMICFQGTEIDYLYFAMDEEEGFLVKKNEVK
jgi:carbamoyltransferase